MTNNNIKLEDIELSKATFNSNKKLTELIDKDFLNEIKEEIGDVECINLIFNITSEDKNQSPQLIILNHNNDESIKNKKISIEMNPIKSSFNNTLKKFINILIKKGDNND